MSRTILTEFNKQTSVKLIWEIVVNMQRVCAHRYEMTNPNVC